MIKTTLPIAISPMIAAAIANPLSKELTGAGARAVRQPVLLRTERQWDRRAAVLAV
jgi:hypothetical protein